MSRHGACLPDIRESTFAQEVRLCEIDSLLLLQNGRSRRACVFGNARDTIRGDVCFFFKPGLIHRMNARGYCPRYVLLFAWFPKLRKSNDRLLFVVGIGN